eukprot:1877943-Amphidinium_carterae.2
MAIVCFAFMNNIIRKDGVSAWDRRHGEEFKGKLIPFGAMVNFKQTPVKEDKQMKFAPRSVPGLFLGYHLGTGQKWKGEYLCISLVDYENESYRSVQRIKEVVVFDDNEFKFPIAEKSDPYVGDWRLCHEHLGSESTGGVRGLSFPYKDDTTSGGGTKDVAEMDDDPPIDPNLIPRPREEGQDEIPDDVGQEEEGPTEKEIPEPKMARESKDVDRNQGRKPDWWPVDRPFYPGRRSGKSIMAFNSTHAEHQRRKELELLTKEWLQQLKKWHEEGKDDDIIYDPRPKDPSFPPKPSGAESSGSGGPTIAIEVVEGQVTTPIAEFTRDVIEFCCDDDGSLGKACPKGCKVMRITKGMDATKSTTVEKAMSAIEGENTTLQESTTPSMEMTQNTRRKCEITNVGSINCGTTLFKSQSTVPQQGGWLRWNGRHHVPIGRRVG